MAYQFGHLDPDERIEFVDEERPHEAPARAPRLPRVLWAVIVAAVVIAGMWFSYKLGTHHPSATGAADSVPLIRADQRPTKVKPAQPGGMEIPDRDTLIYGQHPNGSTTERLLPPPEAPIARPPAPGQAVVPPDPNLPAAAPAAPAPAPPAVAGKPAPTLNPAGAAARGVRVQLGAMHSEEAAKREWERLKRKNGDLLGSLSADMVRADLGDRGVFYRIQAGPVADLKEAERICGEMKRRDFGCNIVR